MEIEGDNCIKLKKSKKVNFNSNTMQSSKNSDVFKGEEATENSENNKETKIKLKNKLKNVNKILELDNSIDETLTEQCSTSKLKKKKKKKKRKFEAEPKEELSCEDFDKAEEPTKKKKTFQPKSNEKYTPGMLSDLMQIKKYGQVIIPWDPNFGLDKQNEGNTRNQEDGDSSKPKLKINPLFDLSRRNPASLSNEAESTYFVGNLPSNTRVMELKKLFSKCGIIYKAKIKKKKLRTPKKSDENGSVAAESKTVNAIIKFKTLKSSEAVLNMNGTLYEGHHLRITSSKNVDNIKKEGSVFVGNLAFNAEDDVLWKTFEDCGEIESVRIIRDERSGKGRGFGYVNFKSAGSVEEALMLDGKLVMNRELRVKRHSIRAASLSNLITVKRKHKKRKSVPNKEMVTEPVKKLKKTKKASQQSCVNTEAQGDVLISKGTDLNHEKKIKKKKKKTTNKVAEEVV